jgi:hypothetical protein
LTFLSSDAELTYGSLSVDATEQMKEIGELGLHIWKTQMIEPLTKVLDTGAENIRKLEGGGRG